MLRSTRVDFVSRTTQRRSSARGVEMGEKCKQPFVTKANIGECRHRVHHEVARWDLVAMAATLPISFQISHGNRDRIDTYNGF
jgi:hypothetical protein